MTTTLKLLLLVALLGQPLLVIAQCRPDIPMHRDNRFVDNLDGTVTDELTGLMWMRCPLGRTWKAETQECEVPFEGTKRLDIQDTWNRVLVETENLNLNGGYASYTDWRVPNIKELASISMLHCFPPIDTSAFVDAASTIAAQQFWSSTPSRKRAEITLNKDTENEVKEWRTMAWSFSLVNSTSSGKASEAATNEKHHVMLVRGQSQ